MDKDDELLTTNRYLTIKERHRICDMLRKVYGKKIKECYFQIVPKISSHAIQKDFDKYKEGDKFGKQ